MFAGSRNDAASKRCKRFSRHRMESHQSLFGQALDLPAKGMELAIGRDDAHRTAHGAARKQAIDEFMGIRGWH
jgi:hypothetical protein